MNYKPSTANEVREKMLIPAGEYDYEIIEAKEMMSKGNPEKGTKPRPMLLVKHLVYYGESTRYSDRYFMLDDDSFGALRNLCEATGLLKKYEDNTLQPDDLEGKCGRLKLKIAHNKFKDEDENKITKYIVPKAESTTAQPGPDDLAREAEDADFVP